MNISKLGRILFISDFHFFHQKIIRLCNRKPSTWSACFADEIEMNAYMIESYNKIVRPNDTVINLGDFALCMFFDQLEFVFKQLNGKMHIVTGNHDHYTAETRKRLNRLPFVSISDHNILFENKFLLSHRPVVDPRYPNIHGHTHDRFDPNPMCQNVSIEVLDYKPIELDQVIANFKTRNVL